MSNIYAAKQFIMNSKLFMTSTRQHEILAAIENPVNVELVEQLEEYISDEYAELLSPTTSEEDSNDSPSEVEYDDESANEWDFDEEEHTSTDVHSPARFTSNTDELDGMDEDSSDIEQSNDSPSPDSVDMNSSTSVTKDNLNKNSNLADSIKNILGASDVTSGVSRVSMRGDEVWVHFNDNTNLNHVMYPTIEACSLLRFNRLARTENAVVFTVNGD